MDHASSVDSSFKFTTGDTAQKTVNDKFGTPEFAGLSSGTKVGDNGGSISRDNSSGKPAGYDAPDGEATGGDAIGGDATTDNATGGGVSSRDNKPGEKPTDGKPSELQKQEMESNGKAGESEQKNGKYGFDKPATLNADELQRAGEEGRLTEMLTKAGVDVKDPAALNEYLSRAFDNHIILGLIMAGEEIPANPTDADLGKAILPTVSRSSEHGLKQALEADPAMGYQLIRDNFIKMQNRALENEK